MDPASYSSDRNSNRGGNLVIREADDVAHHDRLPEVEGKIEQGLLDVVIEGNRGEDLIGGLSDVPTEESQVSLVGQGNGWTPTLSTDIVEEGIAGDPPEPTFERPRLVIGETGADAEEYLLHEIVGVVRVPAEAIRIVVDLATVAARDLVPGDLESIIGGTGNLPPLINRRGLRHEASSSKRSRRTESSGRTARNRR
jgi:hypothetical protein